MSEDKKIRLLVAGGGTGGHLYPAFAIVEEVAARDLLEEVLFVGTPYGIEAKKVPEKGYSIKFIWISGFQRGFTVQNFLFPFKLLASLVQANQIIREFMPDVVLGTGGYVSGPVLYVATRRGLPTLIQEQNSFPGVTTRLLASRVDRVHITFDISRKYFKRQDNLFLTGNPISRKIKNERLESDYHKFGLDPNKQTILIIGGSQGAHRINSLVLQSMPWLMEHPQYQIIWSTGKNDYDEIVKICDIYGPRIWKQPFIDDMSAAYSITDLAVSRAGALTLTELSIAGIPAILIPYPYAAGQHQLNNARVLEEQGAAMVIEEKNLTSEKLFADIFYLLNNSELLQNMQKNMLSWANPQAARDVVNSLIEIANKK
jgi:UDP-N-acetylglucosamine--N-acetylmuramyl-(pentapeptide) pyrophosphoryl-undecaprenol N-acetylglucosamine transferase